MQNLAFDVYGTLIDTQGVLIQLRAMIGEKAELFSNTWRSKQLEYSFRKGLMQQYENFTVCTSQALEYSCQLLVVELSQSQKQQLMDSYLTLPAFDDAVQSVQELAKSHRLYAFSNGTPNSVKSLLVNAGIEKYFIDIISADEIATFKPDPKLYQHFLDRTGAKIANTWLISSNPFDIIGAANSGFKTAWVKRSNQQMFDPWKVEPDIVISQLNYLSAALE